MDLCTCLPPPRTTLVCLSVTNVHITSTDRIFIKIVPEMYPWKRKNQEILEVILTWIQIWEFLKRILQRWQTRLFLPKSGSYLRKFQLNIEVIPMQSLDMDYGFTLVD